MEENKFCLYIHEFPNGKVYIGVTSESPNKRWHSDGSGYKRQDVIWREIERYGWDNIIHDILAVDLTKDEAERLEKEWIAYYDSTNHDYGYNIQAGGFLKYGYNHSEDTKAAMSKKMTGEGNPFYGKKHTQATKNIISKKNKGKYIGGKSKRAKPVYQMDISTKEIIAEFDCASTASRELNIERKHISACCNGKRISAGGFSWQFIDEPHPYQGNWSSMKSVCQIDLDTGNIIKEFMTMRQAVNELGVPQDMIKKCCDGKRRSAYGFAWSYADECCYTEEVA